MKKIEKYDVITTDITAIEPIKVLIVDDQKFVRNFLQNILESEPNFKLIGTANNGKDAIKKVSSFKPDVILIDLEMPEMDGVTATEIIALKYPQSKVLVLSSYQDSEHLQKALLAGAKGYILKDSTPQEITQAIYAIARGHSQLSPGLLEKVLTPKVEIVPEAQREVGAILSPKNWQESVLKIKENLPYLSLKKIASCLLFTTAIVIPLTILIKVEQTITASGKLEAKENIITIDAPIKSKVVALEVTAGTKIAKGETIVKLESPLIATKLKEQQQKLVTQNNQLANLNLLKKQQELALKTKQQENKAQELEQQSIIEELQDDLDKLKTDYSNQISEQYTKLERAKKEISQAKSAQKIAQIRYETAQEKTNQYKKAYQNNVIGKERLLEIEQNLREQKNYLERTLSEIDRTTAIYQEKQNSYNQRQQKLSEAIKQAALRVQEQQNKYQSLIQNQDRAIFEDREAINQAEYNIITLQRELTKSNSVIENLKLQLERHNLFTPVDGIVFQLSATKVGSVVEAGEVLAKIIPQESPLILNAIVNIDEQNSDFLTIGLPVRLALDDYPPRKYGFVSGRITEITPTVLSNNIYYQEISDKLDLDKAFEIKIELDRNYLKSPDTQILLTPEQSVTAEVILGKQRLINVFFEP